MTDNLRDRIGKVIFDRSGLGDLYPQVDWSELSEGHRERYRLDGDAILAIPGIAVVELPEPAGAVRCWPALVGGEPESVYRAGDEIVVSGGLRVYADEARDLAAALLAAADYAERDQ